MHKTSNKIAVIGGGASALHICKNLVDARLTNLEIHVFEQSKSLGSGMPYGHDGANPEHDTNVSANEIPELITPVATWLNSIDPIAFQKYGIDENAFNEYAVLPRLLFGRYLEDQFKLVIEIGRAFNITFKIHLETKVDDVKPGL